MILILAILFAGIGIFMIVEHFRFRARATMAAGEVVEVIERESWSSTGSNAETASGRKVIQYIPVWQVMAENGQPQRIESTEGSSDMNFPIGTRHKILLDPQQPGTGRLASSGPWFWVMLCFAGSAFLVFADWIDLFQ